MDLQQLLVLAERYALPLTFVVSLLARAGVPVPASPLLVVMGALAVSSGAFALQILLAATLGAAAGDAIWYWAGRRLGRRVLAVVCRLSLSKDVCVEQSETLFVRWGRLALFAAKFLPGISAVAPPLAGALGWSWRVFMRWNLAASAFWALAFLGVGALFSDQLEQVLVVLSELGSAAVWLLAVLLALYITARFLRRRRASRMAQMPRMSVAELKAAIDAGTPPLIIDVRSSEARELDPRVVPGAMPIGLKEIRTLATKLEPGRDVVLYCNCPNEASAAMAARQLLAFRGVRALPLAGGLEAWYELENRSCAEAPAVRK